MTQEIRVWLEVVEGRQVVVVSAGDRHGDEWRPSRNHAALPVEVWEKILPRIQELVAEGLERGGPRLRVRPSHVPDGESGGEVH